MKELSTKTDLLYDAGENEITRVICSDDLKRWFAVVKTLDMKLVVIADGVPGPEYDHIGKITLLPDGSRVFYRARRNGRDYIIIGGKETREHEVQGDAFRVLSDIYPDAKEEMCWIPAWSARYLDTPDDILADEARKIKCWRGEGPWFSPDLSRFACVVLRGSRMLMMSNEGLSPEYDLVGKPVFSKDGKHMAYPVVRNRKAFVVHNGEEIPSPGPVAELRISPDGLHIAWVSTIPFPDPVWTPDDEFVILDSHVGQSFESIEAIGFSSDCRELLYMAKDGNRLIRVSVKMNEGE